MTTETSEEIIVLPFEVECDHPRNCDVLLQSIVNCRLRSAFDGMKAGKDRNGRPCVPVDQALTFASFPRIPGMRLRVNPARGKYEIIDPLYDDRNMCEEIERWQKANQPVTSHVRVSGKPPEKGDLDVHRMKTLCKELCELLVDKQIKVTQGPTPKPEEIARLPGRFLLNPGSRVTNTQPIYSDEFDEWVQNLSRHGG